MTNTISMSKKELQELISKTVKETISQMISDGVLKVEPKTGIKADSIAEKAAEPVKKTTKKLAENKLTNSEKSKGFKRAHRTAKVQLEDVKYIMTDFGKCEVGHFVHTKTGETMYAVRACEKLDREVYVRMADTMRTLGFSWSLYAMAFIGTDSAIADKLTKKAVA